jgi:hypothetical protein
MEATTKDLTSLRLPAAALAISAVVAVAMVNISSNNLSRVDSELRGYETALQEARSRYQRWGEEREIIVRYLPLYQRLEQQGLVGAERRINWLEGLRLANAQAGLFGVDYQLGVRESFPLADKSSPIASRIHHSPMRLTFGLVHEGDLLRFFRALGAQQAGFFSLTGCTLDRGGRTSAPEPRQVNINAQCQLSWVTISKQEGKP